MAYVNKISALLVAAVITGGALSSYGQIIYNQPMSGDAQMIYTCWKMETDTVSSTLSQFTIPVNGFFPLGDNFEARFYLANAANKFEYEDYDFTLNGLSDMRLQFNRSLAEDRLLISAGINLPTGKKKLNLTEEWLVLEFLSQNYLNFPVRRLGEGMGLNFLFGGATMAGIFRLGGSVEYQYNGTYEPYEIGGDYKPGNHIALNVGADTRRDKMTYSAGIIFTTYTDDKLEDEKVFRQSNQVDLRLSGTYDEDKYSLGAAMRYLIRDRNKRYSDDGRTLEQLKAYGNEFLFNSRFTYHPDKKWFVAPLAEIHLVAANEYDFGSSKVFGFGADIGRQINPDVNIGLGMKYFTGDADGGNIDISGYQLSAILSAAF